MDEAKLYYTPPSDEIFNDMKQVSLQIWKNYEEPYRSEQCARIVDIKNVGDNFMYMLAMMDPFNQKMLGLKVKPETKEALRERLISGGQPEEFMPF